MDFWNKVLKPTLKKVGIHKIWHILKNFLESRYLTTKSREDIFTRIYQKNSWKGKESVSGRGSDMDETEELLLQLPLLLKKYQIKTVIDLPCGDFNWMQHLDYDFDHYTGIDIVEEIIQSNNKKYSNEKRFFKKKDCLNDDIGSADMLMCRDLLIHFSEEDIFSFLNNIQKAKIDYFLTTHFNAEENSNIVTGQWHPINLTLAPYNFPAPLDQIVEKTKMFNGKFMKSKTMALWRVSDIRSVIKKVA